MSGMDDESGFDEESGVLFNITGSGSQSDEVSPSDAPAAKPPASDGPAAMTDDDDENAFAPSEPAPAGFNDDLPSGTVPGGGQSQSQPENNGVGSVSELRFEALPPLAGDGGSEPIPMQIDQQSLAVLQFGASDVAEPNERDTDAHMADARSEPDGSFIRQPAGQAIVFASPAQPSPPQAAAPKPLAQSKGTEPVERGAAAEAGPPRQKKTAVPKGKGTKRKRTDSETESDAEEDNEEESSSEESSENEDEGSDADEKDEDGDEPMVKKQKKPKAKVKAKAKGKSKEKADAKSKRPERPADREPLKPQLVITEADYKRVFGFSATVDKTKDVCSWLVPADKFWMITRDDETNTPDVDEERVFTAEDIKSLALQEKAWLTELIYFVKSGSIPKQGKTKDEFEAARKEAIDDITRQYEAIGGLVPPATGGWVQASWISSFVEFFDCWCWNNPRIAALRGKSDVIGEPLNELTENIAITLWQKIADELDDAKVPNFEAQSKADMEELFKVNDKENKRDWAHPEFASKKKQKRTKDTPPNRLLGLHGWAINANTGVVSADKLYRCATVLTSSPLFWLYREWRRMANRKFNGIAPPLMALSLSNSPTDFTDKKFDHLRSPYTIPLRVTYEWILPSDDDKPKPAKKPKAKEKKGDKPPPKKKAKGEDKKEEEKSKPKSKSSSSSEKPAGDVVKMEDEPNAGDEQAPPEPLAEPVDVRGMLKQLGTTVHLLNDFLAPCAIGARQNNRWLERLRSQSVGFGRFIVNSVDGSIRQGLDDLCEHWRIVQPLVHASRLQFERILCDDQTTVANNNSLGNPDVTVVLLQPRFAEENSFDKRGERVEATVQNAAERLDTILTLCSLLASKVSVLLARGKPENQPVKTLDHFKPLAEFCVQLLALELTLRLRTYDGCSIAWRQEERLSSLFELITEFAGLFLMFDLDADEPSHQIPETEIMELLHGKFAVYMAMFSLAVRLFAEHGIVRGVVKLDKKESVLVEDRNATAAIKSGKRLLETLGSSHLLKSAVDVGISTLDMRGGLLGKIVTQSTVPPLDYKYDPSDNPMVYAMRQLALPIIAPPESADKTLAQTQEFFKSTVSDWAAGKGYGKDKHGKDVDPEALKKAMNVIVDNFAYLPRSKDKTAIGVKAVTDFYKGVSPARDDVAATLTTVAAAFSAAQSAVGNVMKFCEKVRDRAAAFTTLLQYGSNLAAVLKDEDLTAVSMFALQMIAVFNMLEFVMSFNGQPLLEQKSGKAVFEWVKAYGKVWDASALRLNLYTFILLAATARIGQRGGQSDSWSPSLRFWFAQILSSPRLQSTMLEAKLHLQSTYAEQSADTIEQRLIVDGWAPASDKDEVAVDANQVGTLLASALNHGAALAAVLTNRALPIRGCGFKVDSSKVDSDPAGENQIPVRKYRIVHAIDELPIVKILVGEQLTQSIVRAPTVACKFTLQEYKALVKAQAISREEFEKKKKSKGDARDRVMADIIQPNSQPDADTQPMADENYVEAMAEIESSKKHFDKILLVSPVIRIVDPDHWHWDFFNTLNMVTGYHRELYVDTAPNGRGTDAKGWTDYETLRGNSMSVISHNFDMSDSPRLDSKESDTSSARIESIQRFSLGRLATKLELRTDKPTDTSAPRPPVQSSAVPLEQKKEDEQPLPGDAGSSSSRPPPASRSTGQAAMDLTEDEPTPTKADGKRPSQLPTTPVKPRTAPGSPARGTPIRRPSPARSTPAKIAAPPKDTDGDTEMEDIPISSPSPVRSTPIINQPAAAVPKDTDGDTEMGDMLEVLVPTEPQFVYQHVIDNKDAKNMLQLSTTQQAKFYGFQLPPNTVVKKPVYVTQLHWTKQDNKETKHQVVRMQILSNFTQGPTRKGEILQKVELPGDVIYRPLSSLPEYDPSIFAYGCEDDPKTAKSHDWADSRAVSHSALRTVKPKSPPNAPSTSCVVLTVTPVVNPTENGHVFFRDEPSNPLLFRERSVEFKIPKLLLAQKDVRDADFGDFQVSPGTIIATIGGHYSSRRYAFAAQCLGFGDRKVELMGIPKPKEDPLGKRNACRADLAAIPVTAFYSLDMTMLRNELSTVLREKEDPKKRITNKETGDVYAPTYEVGRSAVRASTSFALQLMRESGVDDALKLLKKNGVSGVMGIDERLVKLFGSTDASHGESFGRMAKPTDLRSVTMIKQEIASRLPAWREGVGCICTFSASAAAGEDEPNCELVAVGPERSDAGPLEQDKPAESGISRYLPDIALRVIRPIQLNDPIIVKPLESLVGAFEWQLRPGRVIALAARANVKAGSIWQIPLLPTGLRSDKNEFVESCAELALGKWLERLSDVLGVKEKDEPLSVAYKFATSNEHKSRVDKLKGVVDVYNLDPNRIVDVRNRGPDSSIPTLRKLSLFPDMDPLFLQLLREKMADRTTEFVLPSPPEPTILLTSDAYLLADFVRGRLDAHGMSAQDASVVDLNTKVTSIEKEDLGSPRYGITALPASFIFEAHIHETKRPINAIATFVKSANNSQPHLAVLLVKHLEAEPSQHFANEYPLTFCFMNDAKTAISEQQLDRVRKTIVDRVNLGRIDNDFELVDMLRRASRAQGASSPPLFEAFWNDFDTRVSQLNRL